MGLDITPTLELRSRIGARREFADIDRGPFCLVAKACLRAMERTVGQLSVGTGLRR